MLMTRTTEAALVCVENVNKTLAVLFTIQGCIC